MTKKNILKVSKTARYFTKGTLGAGTKEIWIVCHGYGQSAEYFIEKFSVLEDETCFIVAPEALNRFYLQGFSGRVGASWMTKVEREAEIADYINYLDTLFYFLFKKINFCSIRLNVLGFSQGVATVCRWVTEKQVPFSRLFLWSGIFPPDLNTDFAFSVEKLKDKEVIVVYGNRDPLLKPEHEKEIENLKQIKPDLKVVYFDGGHEINNEVLIGF